jgi:hypothetical protein
MSKAPDGRRLDVAVCVKFGTADEMTMHTCTDDLGSQSCFSFVDPLYNAPLDTPNSSTNPLHLQWRIRPHPRFPLVPYAHTLFPRTEHQDIHSQRHVRPRY